MESIAEKLPLHSWKPLRRRIFNRVFALIYSAAISGLLYRHARCLLLHPTFTAVALLTADIILAFMWLNSQAFRMNPVVSEPFPQNLHQVVDDFPALDVFICTADPSKEPPVRVAATALSAMAYDYPTEKLSVYVSDDGASELTLFALLEAAKFGKEWLPFCKDNRVMERCPEAYFASNCAIFNPDTNKIKEMYDNMKRRIEDVVKMGYIGGEYKSSAEANFAKWGQHFTIQDHPPIIQVISQSSEDKDGTSCCSMPNLIYLSRQKSHTSPHHFKAGALNALLRVSAAMTNAPIILTLDCDMVSNDPSTPHKMLCYFMDPSLRPELGYVQFPNRFHGLNKADIYGSEFKRIYHFNPVGLNGLLGPDYFGTGTFFNRRVFYGGPSSIIGPELPELGPGYVVKKPINDPDVLDLAHRVTACEYEATHIMWGSKIGFRYGSLVEDFYTGYLLHCSGWKSIFCNPKRAAFLSEMPISLNDVLTQTKRWTVGLLEVALSKYSPLTFGPRFIGPLMAHCYSYYAFGPFWSFPIMVYAFLPQTTMLNNIYIFPKASDPWFLLYIFLCLGAYGQDLVEFLLGQGSPLRWWSDQRMWLIRGLSSDLFGTTEYISNHLGLITRGFNVTNKVNDEQLRKRYDEGRYEFGVASPMFVPFSTAAIVNLVALLGGLVQVLRGRVQFDQVFGQVIVACFAVANCLPVYEAMVLRTDHGRMPAKITLVSLFLACFLFAVVSLI